MARKGRKPKPGKRNPKTGRRINTRALEEDNLQVGLAARCRQLGWKPTPANITKARADYYGCNAGRALAKNTKGDSLEDLWTAVKHIRNVVARYYRVHGLPNPYPKCASIDMSPERIDAGAVGEVSTNILPRSEDDEARLATNAYQNTDLWLFSAGTGARQEVRAVVIEDAPVRDVAGYLAGLAAVSEGLKGGARDV